MRFPVSIHHPSYDIKATGPGVIQASYKAKHGSAGLSMIKLNASSRAPWPAPSPR